ncbi:sulfatase-like hydrolase/transferase [Tamlana sp. 2_MG-2023]|uniref:sulfatase-like hydrolase/transferase n=1 Tax=unclassified Tamlana TaxID=2614803 RepID=UPI0026E1E1F8|nr:MULTISPECIES: sulfatase-like hydrolase/transferase [unclassified Tamlana]MDO6761260.1 sulfatase-like hydrolase/transferase [Tamlana sp. 2_MG-2023]MDO6791743.1 sulfatase-like hydrolase/transferase [Tamlana sp. 1_MG-2023]
MNKSILVLLYFLTFYSCSFAQINILFIESDDQSNQALGAYGNAQMKTPNIDKLATEGVSFLSAYNMGCWSPAVCIPSRTMLMYGQYLWSSQKINKKNAPKSFPEKLQEHGYYTYMTGKWHAMGKGAKTIFNETGSIQPGQLKTYNSKAGHITDITGNEAVNFIKSYKNSKPFFLYVAFNAPHVPRQTEQKYYDLYPTDHIELPPSVIDNTPLNKNVKYQYAPSPLRSKTMQTRVQQNNAMVTHMDARIGDIITALKAQGLYDKTIIVFTSDHGINFGENGVAGKVCLYEPSVTAPLIIKAPKIKAGSTISERVYLQDVTPTLFDLLDIKTSSQTDFKSLKPLIDNKGEARKSIYLAMFDDQRGIISEDHKLIIYPKTGVLELYDLSKDPWELNNLVSKKPYKSTITNLLKELKSWQNKTEDTTDLTTIYNKYI